MTGIPRRGVSAFPLTPLSAGAVDLDGIWQLFAEAGGSLRVIAAIAEILGMAGEGSLPRPLHGLSADRRERLRAQLADLGVL